MRAEDPLRVQAASAVVKLAERKKDAATSRPGAAAVPGQDDARTPHDPVLLREAVGLYRIALEIRPDPTVLHWLGMAEETLGDFDAALASFQALAEMCADDLPPPLQHMNKSYRDVAWPALQRLKRKRAGIVAPPAAAPLDLEQLLAGFDVQAATERTSEPVPPDADAASEVAAEFGERLADGDFDGAHALLAMALRAELPADALRDTVTRMMDGARVEQAGILTSMHRWAAQEPQDVLWAYVSLEAAGSNEAATVIVTRDTGAGGRLAIRHIEWGRP